MATGIRREEEGMFVVLLFREGRKKFKERDGERERERERERKAQTPMGRKKETRGLFEETAEKDQIRLTD